LRLFQKSSAGNAVATSTYENTAYEIRLQYPSHWSVQQLNASGTLINIATFVSPTGPNSNPTAEVAIYMDRLDNSTTNLNNYAHFVAFTDYEKLIFGNQDMFAFWYTRYVWYDVDKKSLSK
jgi:hypothetical protein